MKMKSNNLPTATLKVFVQVLARDLSLLEFENWLYKEKGLEEILPETTYLGLLELDYNTPGALYKLNDLLKGMVSIGSVEAYELLKLIERLEAEGEEFPEALQECYDLYSDGCYFLENLGLNWGLMLRVPPAQYHADHWDDLSVSEKGQLLSSLDLKQIRQEVSLFKKWIENQEIIVVKHRDKFPRYEFIDHRLAGDKSEKSK